MYLNILPTCVSGAFEVRSRPQIPGTGAKDGCELSRGCWEPNPIFLQEEQEILTSEPSLQPHPILLMHACHEGPPDISPY